MKVSASIELIWQLAVREAIAAEFKEIEPEHFLIALLKFSEIPVVEVEKLGVGAEVVKVLTSDIEALKTELGNRKVDAGAIRRELRRAVGKGAARYEGGQMHRAPATREFFDKAAKAAADAGNDLLMGWHILVTMLESPTPVLAKVFAGVGGTKAVGEPLQPLILLYEYGKDLNRLATDSKSSTDNERTAEARAVLGVLGQAGRNSVFLATDDCEAASKVVYAAARLIMSKDVAPGLRGKHVIDLSELPGGTVSSRERADLLERLLIEAGSARGIILYLPAVFSRVQKPLSWADTLRTLAIAGKLQFVARIPGSARKQIEKDATWRKAARVVSIGGARTAEIPFEL